MVVRIQCYLQPTAKLPTITQIISSSGLSDTVSPGQATQMHPCPPCLDAEVPTVLAAASRSLQAFLITITLVHVCSGLALLRFPPKAWIIAPWRREFDPVVPVNLRTSSYALISSFSHFPFTLLLGFPRVACWISQTPPRQNNPSTRSISGSRLARYLTSGPLPPP